jgi:hypothetical protein
LSRAGVVVGCGDEEDYLGMWMLQFLSRAAVYVIRAYSYGTG